MRKVLLDTDPITKTKTYFYHDMDGENFVVQEEAEVDQVLAWNQAMRNQIDERARWGDAGLGEKVASIPYIVWTTLPKELRDDNNELLRWLDRREQEPFRTRHGRLSR